MALSSNEFDLLLFLASRAGEIQSRETLYQQLYKREYDGLDRTLDVRISHLRKKLGDTGAPDRIRTVWGHGYLFVARRLEHDPAFPQLYLLIVIVLAAVSWGQERLWQTYGGAQDAASCRRQRARDSRVEQLRAVPTRAARGLRRRRSRATPGSISSCSSRRTSPEPRRSRGLARGKPVLHGRR